MECLLFTRYIAKLHITVPGGEHKWEVRKTADGVDLLSTREGEVTSTSWVIHARVKPLPIEAREDPDVHDFEIKVALPRGEIADNFVYSYFPTRARFPYRALVHATFDLTANRDHLHRNDANKIILDELAVLLAEIAEANTRVDDPWFALRALTPVGDADPTIKDLGFDAALLGATAARRVIPTRAGVFVAPEKTALLDVPDDAELPKAVTSDLVCWTDEDDILRRLHDLKIRQIESATLRKRLEDVASTMDARARARAIAALLDHDALPEPPPSILLDEQGRNLPASVTKFLPPAQSAAVALPEWMEVHLLNPEMARELAAALGTRSPRDLAHKLRAYDLREFAFATLASAVNAQANDHAKQQSARELDLRVQATKAIYELYRQRPEDELRPAILRVVLPTASGKFQPADELYLSDAYPNGFLIHALYKGVPNAPFIAPPQAFEFETDIRRIETFLEWLGVKRYPKVNPPRQFTSGSLYQSAVVAGISVPAVFSDRLTVLHREELEDAYIGGVVTLDHLEQVLDSAAPEVVIAWLATDTRIEAWRTQGDRLAHVSVYPPRAHNPRIMTEQKILSHAIWVLTSVAWLPTTAGRKTTVAECTLAKNVPEGLEALVPRPTLNDRHAILNRSNVDRQAISAVLLQLGAQPSLDDITWEEFYRLLREMPTRDPEGIHARAAYRHLLTRLPPGESPALREAFREEGKLFGTRGEAAEYFPVAELYYVDGAALPPQIAREIPLLALDPRRGAQRVQTTFGVQPIDSRNLRITIDEVTKAPRDDSFAGEVDQIKHHVLAHRLSAGGDPAGIPRVASLRAHLCRRVRGTAQLGETNIPLDLAGDDPHLLVGDHAYFVTPTRPITGRLLGDHLIADAVGEMFASILRVERGGDYARIAACNPESRKELLQRMLGQDPTHFLSDARHKLGTAEAVPPEPPTGGWFAPPPEPSPPSPTPAPLDPTPVPPERPLVSVEVAPGTYTPEGPRRTIERRVRATPRNLGESRRRKVANAARCEEIALRFEEAQGRFPLPSAHQQGRRAPGCDVISFATAEARETFKETANTELICRFIEVKARSTRDGKVILEGNEYRAATIQAAKYYVYVIFETDEVDEYEVYECVDPLGLEPIPAHLFDVVRAPEGAVQLWYVYEDDSEPSPRSATYSPPADSRGP